MGTGLAESAATWMVAIAMGAVFGGSGSTSLVGYHGPFGGTASVVLEVDPAERREGGFLMEGAPHVEVVFGDSERFRHHVDRFYELHDAMAVLRAEFTSSVQAAIAALTAAPRRACPTDEAGLPYYRAHHAGVRFEELGAELELQHEVIAHLDRYGETAGLTPDYRWRVARAGTLYEALLQDLREMRAAFRDELGAEALARGCERDALLARGERSAEEPRLLASAGRAPAGGSGHRIPLRLQQEPEIVTASPVTFFIDNRECREPLRVFVDGEMLGRVDERAMAAFQAFAGRQSMCILPEGSSAHCGDAGTVRTAFIHDGWSLTLRCEDN